MLGALKKVARRLLARPMSARLVRFRARALAFPARRAFLRGGRRAPGRAWLGREELESLSREYPARADYSWDIESRLHRARARSRRLLLLAGRRTRECLEVGCFDGSVSASLARAGKTATAVDVRSGPFDERAAREGVRFLEMDAAALGFPDDSFDLVFSYNSFEHFPDPESALREAARVVRRGGYVYLDFGPLYMSPKGLHAYRMTGIPYCQHLFPEELLDEVAAERGCAMPPREWLNRWTLTRYRALWDAFARRLGRIVYEERLDPSGLALVRRFPACFSTKTECFDDLLTTSIEVLFRRLR